MYVATAPGDILDELKEASALAIDFGSNEDRGKEQVGNFHEILAALQEGIRSRMDDCLQLRVLRKVLSDSQPSQWGKHGSVVDTTKYDQQFIDMAKMAGKPLGQSNHWYLEENVSPAFLVLENARTLSDGSSILPPSDRNIQILPNLRRAFGPTAYPLVESFLLLQPSIALSDSGLAPEEVLRQMGEKGALSSNGIVVTSREEYARDPYAEPSPF